MTLSISGTATPGSATGTTAATSTLTPAANSLLVVACWQDNGVDTDTFTLTDGAGTLTFTKALDWKGRLTFYTAPVTVSASHTLSLNTSHSGGGIKQIMPIVVTDSGGGIPTTTTPSPAGITDGGPGNTGITLVSTGTGSLNLLMAFTNANPGTVSGETKLTSAVYGGEWSCLYYKTTASTSSGQSITTNASAGCWDAAGIELKVPAGVTGQKSGGFFAAIG